MVSIGTTGRNAVQVQGACKQKSSIFNLNLCESYFPRFAEVDCYLRVKIRTEAPETSGRHCRSRLHGQSLVSLLPSHVYNGSGSQQSFIRVQAHCLFGKWTQHGFLIGQFSCPMTLFITIYIGKANELPGVRRISLSST